MPLDVQKEIFEAIGDALDGFNAFTALVKTGSRIYTGTAKDRVRDRERQTVGEFPKVKLDVGIERTNIRPPRTFGQNSTTYTAATCDYGVPMVINVDVKIIHDKVPVADQTAVEAAFRGAILKTPNLGLAWVNPPMELQGVTRREENNADTGNAARVVDRMRLVINARPLLSALTEDNYL